MQALETFTGLTMEQLGGEEQALIGSTFLEAPGRPTRELFVEKLTAKLQIPDEMYLLDVGANPIWVLSKYSYGSPREYPFVWA